MVRTRKNGLTVLLVAVLFACLAALSFFVPTKGVSAADGTEGSPSDAVMTAEDLQSAISAAGIGDTVALKGNVNGNITVGADADVIIDLNGFEITSSTQGMPTVKNEGKLEIVDGSAGKTGVITRENTATYYVVVNEGDLTLDGVTVRNDNAADTSSLLENNFDCAQESAATLTIESGTYYCAGGNVVKNENYGTLNINGGNFRSDAIDRGGSFSVLLVVGTANITNGTFTSTADGDGVRVVGTNGSTAALDITGGTFTVAASGAKALLLQNGDVDLDKGTLDVNIGGGTFNGDIGVIVHGFAVTATDEITISDGTFSGSVILGSTIKSEITGGIFSETVDSTYYPADFVLCVNDEGKYTVAQLDGIPSGWQRVIVGLEMGTYSAKVYKSFATIQQALDSASQLISDGADPSIVSVTLYDDAMENIVVPKLEWTTASGTTYVRTVRLYLNGYTLTGSDSSPVITNNGAFQLYANKNVTAGGSVIRGADSEGVVIENNGTLSIYNNGILIENLNTAETSYLIENNATLTFSSSTYGGGVNTYAAAGGNLILNNEAATVTINKGNLNGSICNNGGTVSIKGGTYSEIPDYKYFANGYVWTKNESGTFDAVKSEETFVAVIDGIGYTSLLAAMEAAPEGATITLIDEVIVDTEVTLDLSGYIIVIDETFPSDTHDVAIRVIEGGALTITGDGVIDAKLAGDNVVPVAAMRANSSIIMNGGTIIVDTPSESCLFAMGGSITINGGTLENLCKDEYSYGGGRTQVVNISNGTPGKLVINGGTFIGRNPALGDDNLGGTFIAEDAKLAQSTDENGNVVYKALGQDETVAGVDAVYYVENGLAVAEVYTAAALADALAATTGAVKNPAYDVIRLGDDISGNIVVDKGRTLTIDLNGFTLTGADNHTIINNGTLVITDSVGGGKVVVTADGKAALLNYGDATLLGGEFTRETAGTGGWYVIKNYGSLVIGEENKECGVVVDSNGGDESSLLVSGYYDANDEAANEGLITSTNPLKVVINGGTFNGGLNTIKNDSESVMIINGGTFTNGKNYTVQNCNEMTVNGGTFVQTASKDVNGLKAVYALYSDDNTKLTITAGDFTAVTYAVYLKDNVNAVISGGTFDGETALYAGGKVTLTISGGAFTGTEKYGISIDENAVVDISGEETVISGSEYGLRVRSAYGNINISDATISGETAVYMNRPTSYAITSGVFNGAINVTNNTAGISGGKFAVMPNEAYFIEGLTGALVDGYYVTVKATSPVEELRPAIFEAQAAVRSYAAALGINWADIASARAADAQAVLAAYDAIESAASVDLVLVAQLNAMDALDKYAAALAAELDAYKAEKIAALETLAGDGYVPAYAIAAINGAASVAEVDACYNAAVAEINAADGGEVTPPAPSDNGDGVSLTGVYVMLGVILVVAVAALMILLLKKQKQAEAAEAKAAAPLDRELAEVKQAVEADETAAAVSAAAEDDDKEQIVIEANVRTFDEAYGELDEEQKKLFNDVKDYALTKEGAALTELSSGVCVKKGSKQIVKLTVRRGNPVALFVIENEMIKDFRRNSDAPVKLKVKATELVLRSGGDLEAAKAMVDVAVDQIEKDILAAKERRREARRLRRQRKREQKRQ